MRSLTLITLILILGFLTLQASTQTVPQPPPTYVTQQGVGCFSADDLSDYIWAKEENNPSGMNKLITERKCFNFKEGRSAIYLTQSINCGHANLRQPFGVGCEPIYRVQLKRIGKKGYDKPIWTTQDSLRIE